MYRGVELWANHMGENPGTIGNILGTLWEQRKKTKKSLSPHPQKAKNWIIHDGMLSLPIGFMKFLFPKLFVTIFGLG